MSPAKEAAGASCVTSYSRCSVISANVAGMSWMIPVRMVSALAFIFVVFLVYTGLRNRRFCEVLKIFFGTARVPMRTMSCIVCIRTVQNHR